MKLDVFSLPYLIKLSALVFGTPLVLLGVFAVLANVVTIVRMRSLFGASYDGLAFGPLFALVGASFLWPLLRMGHPRQQ